jgi:tetratricopeptide (TPR) repeat protein
MLMVLLVLLVAGPNAQAQQSQEMQALFQAIRSHTYHYGRANPQQMLERVKKSTVQELAVTSYGLVSNPNDAGLLLRRGYAAMDAADDASVLARDAWLHFAALDLEQSLRLDPNNWIAHHDYAETAYEIGTPGYPLAITHFTAAIRINPKSARSYMGRGLTYIMMHDQARATPDLQQALIIDPNLRTELEQQVRDEYARLQDIAGAQQELRLMQQMPSWRVDTTAQTADQCSAHGGSMGAGGCLILNRPH